MRLILALANAAAGLAGSIHVVLFHAPQQLLRPRPWTCRVFAQAHPRVKERGSRMSGSLQLGEVV